MATSPYALDLTEVDPLLRRILEQAPQLERAVKRSVWAEFTQPGNQPFPSDLAFINLVNAIFEVRDAHLTLEDRIKSAYGALVPKADERVASEDAQKLLLALGDAHQYGKNLVTRRLAAHATKATPEPRLVRLARTLKLSDKELYAMAFIAISYGEQLSFDSGRTYSFYLMCRMCEMTMPEGLHFLSSSRQHVVEGIFSPDEDDPVGYGFKIPYTTCLVLTGGELTQNDMLKIDKTILYDLVMEDDDGSLADKFSLRRSAAGIRAKQRKEKSGDDDEDAAAPEEDANGGDDDGAKADEDDVEGGDHEEGDKDADGNIFDFLREEVLAESSLSRAADSDAADSTDSTALAPYTSNTGYLSDHIEWLSTRIRVRNMTRERQQELDKDPKKDLQLRELAAKERMLKAKCDKRLALTLEAGAWVPRLERLAARLQLDTFEKNVLLTLTGNIVSSSINPDISSYSSGSFSSFTVRNLLNVFCDGFEEEIQCRKYFYKSAKLIKDSILRLSDSWTSELMTNTVELDRRMLDFIVGLDTEFSELVEGSHLYTPVVDLQQVILPEDQKQLITRTVANFDNFARSRKRLGFDQVMSYGAGILLLFFGKSGTGKTMMANAVAKMLGKRILLINYPSLGYNVSDQVIQFIFREAKLNDAVLFFDECESIFQSRDSFSGGVNLLLTEIERHNSLIIMATNRAYDLDEAMHRRITLAIEFKNPDPFLRAAIWKAHIPPTVSLKDDVRFDELAVRYELTGGLIKNAILYALSEAVNRNAEKPVIEQKDLQQGALHQLRGHLSMVDFDRRVVPSHSLDEIIVEAKIYKQLQHIVQMEKARQVLYSEWGFSEKMINDQGTTCLFHGPPGTGKTVAAEAIGFETGRPLKVVNCAELVSKYVGQTGKNIESMFEEAKAMDAILVFDDAEALFGKRTNQSNSTDRYANMDTGLLLYHMERFPGICVVTTNLIHNIDEAFFRRFRFIVEFSLPPAALREKLWRVHLPAKAPLAPDVDFRSLAERFAFTGGVIKNCCFKAASAVALRVEPSKRVITMADLVEAASDHNEHTSSSAPAQMFS